MKAKRWFQFIAAVTLAAFAIRRFTPAEIRQSIRAIVRSIFAKPGDMVSDDIYQRRMAMCRECVIFYPPLETCGSPLRDKELRIGCFCYLPKKNRLKSATCWARDNHIDSGWSNELM